MKKQVVYFVSILLCIIAASSCQSKLTSSSSSEDSVSYAIGITWGHQSLYNNLRYIDVGDIAEGIKEQINSKEKQPEDLISMEIKIKDYVKNTKGVKPNDKQKKYIQNLLAITWAEQLRNMQISRINLSYTKQGIKDVLKYDTTGLSMSLNDAQAYITLYKTNLELQKNIQRLNEGRAFLEENKKKEGIITTESGLQYKVIEQGNDVRATDNDTLHIKIISKTIQGETLSSTINENFVRDREFNLQCIYEALDLFGEGSKFILYSPSELAFGSEIKPWVQRDIKPNMVLIYEIEINKILNKQNLN